MAIEIILSLCVAFYYVASVPYFEAKMRSIYFLGYKKLSIPNHVCIIIDKSPHYDAIRDRHRINHVIQVMLLIRSRTLCSLQSVCRSLIADFTFFH